MGAAMSGPGFCRQTCLALAALACVCAFDGSALAAERYALIVTGASGSSEYALKYQSWRAALMATLGGQFSYPDDHIITLAEEEKAAARKPTRENVRAALAELQHRTASDDVVFVLLIGHGTVGGLDEAKFNLVGPDMSADEWAAALKPIAGRLVLVNSASGSFPYLQKLAAPGRIVITATGLPAQEYETVFPEFFVRAFEDTAADADKNGKVSIWEAFAYASAAVKKWFDERGQLSTERAILDDTGDGHGREADDAKGVDGAIAQVTYLRPDTPIAAPAGSEMSALLTRRADLEAQLDLLRARKPNLSQTDYETQLEKLLLDLARLDQDIRSRTR
jgi:hypothetical protein